MLSYQHGYHAGGPADLHKHLILSGLLRLLTRKPRAISYLESHAGRGLYDLGSDQARKTGEAARGIERLGRLDHPLQAAQDAARREAGQDAYPGSPFIARALLRSQDRLHLMELHPQEHTALKAALAAPNVAIHRRDGHEGLIALTPPDPARGLALIDPSYEVKDEYARTARTALALLRRWPVGVVAIWYPLIDGRHRALTDALAPARPLIDEVEFHDRPARGMIGSGMALLNAPYGAQAALAEALAAADAVLAR